MSIEKKQRVLTEHAEVEKVEKVEEVAVRVVLIQVISDNAIVQISIHFNRSIKKALRSRKAFLSSNHFKNYLMNF